MFIRKKHLYEECSRMIAKERAKCGGETSTRVITLRTLIFHLHGTEGLKTLDKYIKKQNKKGD